mmetsp:Transcript_49423/g.92012  ORF Transcript_49423/g.92012 Transcript_49423/m.92012 type:complete len:217 (-) Transcript_49423:116-766(-)
MQMRGPIPGLRADSCTWVAQDGMVLNLQSTRSILLCNAPQDRCRNPDSPSLSAISSFGHVCIAVLNCARIHQIVLTPPHPPIHHHPSLTAEKTARRLFTNLPACIVPCFANRVAELMGLGAYVCNAPARNPAALLLLVFVCSSRQWHCTIMPLNLLTAMPSHFTTPTPSITTCSLSSRLEHRVLPTNSFRNDFGPSARRQRRSRKRSISTFATYNY